MSERGRGTESSAGAIDDEEKNDDTAKKLDAVVA